MIKTYTLMINIQKIKINSKIISNKLVLELDMKNGKTLVNIKYIYKPIYNPFHSKILLSYPPLPLSTFTTFSHYWKRAQNITFSIPPPRVDSLLGDK